MTREEARDWLMAISFVSDHHIEEALNMAIETLSAPQTDLISRADAVEAVRKCKVQDIRFGNVTSNMILVQKAEVIGALFALPSAEAESDDLIIKGAKGIKDGLYNIKDGELFQYKAKGGTVRVYSIVPSAEAVDVVRCQDCKHWKPWICSEHNVHTHEDDFCSFGVRSEESEVDE